MNIVVFGQVVGVHVDERYIVDGRVDLTRSETDCTLWLQRRLCRGRSSCSRCSSLNLKTGPLAVAGRGWLDLVVMVVEAVGAVLVCGGLACAGAAVLRRRHRVAAALFAAALAAPRRRRSAPTSAAGVACGLGFAGAVAMVVSGSAGPRRSPWLDFLMGGCAVGALAVTTGAELSAALAAAGVAAALGPPAGG